MTSNEKFAPIILGEMVPEKCAPLDQSKDASETQCRLVFDFVDPSNPSTYAHNPFIERWEWALKRAWEKNCPSMSDYGYESHIYSPVELKVISKEIHLIGVVPKHYQTHFEKPLKKSIQEANDELMRDLKKEDQEKENRESKEAKNKDFFKTFSDKINRKSGDGNT